jgi:glycosyltransferase involved in cell wall biosynthesis
VTRSDAALRIAILALSAKSYGGDSYFRAILPALERYGEGAEFVVLAADERYRRYFTGTRVRLATVQAPVHWARRFVWEQTVLPKVLRRLRVDVLYTANNVGVFRSRVPCVIAVRNMEPLVPQLPGTPATLRARLLLLRWLTRASVRRAARVVAVSQYVKETLLAQGARAERLDVIYHGVDDLEDEPPSEQEQTRAPVDYVAAAGKFVRYANLTTLVAAYGRMRERGFAGELWFAGGSYDAGYEREIKALVRGLGLDPYVRFLGYVSRARLQSVIRGCRVFLFPSTLEACPFTLLEAMRRGAPIVATTAPPMPEFCRDAAMYVAPTDSDAFGDAAYELVKDEELAASLRIRARARAASFRWEDSVRQLVHTLRTAVASVPGLDPSEVAGA